MKGKHFKVKKATIQRTNNGGNGSEVGEVFIDHTWDRLRFSPKKSFDFDSADLRDIANLMDKIKK